MKSPVRGTRLPLSAGILATLAVGMLAAAPLASAAGPAPIELGTAAQFAVLADSTVTNTGPTVVTGNLGVSPGTAVIGFPPGVVNAPSTIHAADDVAQQAKDDLGTAYSAAAGLSSTNTPASDLGGLTLSPGVYHEASSQALTGTLTLDGENDPNSVWVFQVGSTLTAASGSSVQLINGASSCNVFWQIGSSATLGTSSVLVGTIMAQSSITLNTAAVLHGRALAQNGAVTLDTNTISTACVPPPPTPPSPSPTTTPSPTNTASPSTTPTPTGSALPSTTPTSAGSALPTTTPTSAGSALPSTTPPVTSSVGNGPSGDSSLPPLALPIGLAVGGLGIAGLVLRRRQIRSRPA